MGFNCGIVGLPNVGKSTLFNAMTAAGAPAANYPFCTIDHHTGVVAVPDRRLNDIVSLIKPKNVVPTSVEFVDIAGLVEGAHKGEGLGNQFLGNIRSVDAIAHVVRCFDDPDVVHQYESVDPLHDIDVITMELILSDLESLEKRSKKTQSLARGGNKEAIKELATLEKLHTGLNEGKPARLMNLDDADQQIAKELGLLTVKPMMYVLNVNESDIVSPSEKVRQVIARAEAERTESVMISASIESDLVELDEGERHAFLHDLGLEEPGLHRLITTGYRLLNLITFFTAGEKECRAWTVRRGAKAPEAAGKIHSDFEKGFIRAEVYSYNDLMKHSSEQKVKEAGCWCIEGADYIVADGDIMHFRFNV